MQIVLLESMASPRVYLADWLGRSLKPRLLTEFPANVRVREASTSPGDSTVAVAVRRENGEDKGEVYLIDPMTGRYERAFEEGEGFDIFRIAFAPGKQSIAFLSSVHAASNPTPSGEVRKGLDIFVYDRLAQRVRLVLRGRADWKISWTPDLEQLTYDTVDGWIESVSLKTQRIEQLVQGQLPAWSPDGKRLAYLKPGTPPHEGIVFIYDPARRISQEVYRLSSGWIRGFFGELYWSPDGRYLSFNVGMDLIGPTIRRCVVVEVDSGQVVRVRSQGMYCGPWLAGQPRGVDGAAAPNGAGGSNGPRK